MKQLPKAVEMLIKNERELCCQDVCTLCKEGVGIEKRAPFMWVHPNGLLDKKIWVICDARRIRHRAVMEKKGDPGARSTQRRR